MILCNFYVRTEVTAATENFDGSYRYRGIYMHSPSSAMPCEEAPKVGDLVWLYDLDEPEFRGTYRVIERSWVFASYGSVSWPYGQEAPSQMTCTLVVEAADGPFRDEAPAPAEEPEEVS